jgi:hypothetical protein
MFNRKNEINATSKHEKPFPRPLSNSREVGSRGDKRNPSGGIFEGSQSMYATFELRIEASRVND